MEITDELFITILKEKLVKIKENLDAVDDTISYECITNSDGFEKNREEYKKIKEELEEKYPQLCDNLFESQLLIRDSSLLLDALIDGI